MLTLTNQPLSWLITITSSLEGGRALLMEKLSGI